MARRRFYRSVRNLVDQLAALVFLAGAIGLLLLTMAFEEPIRFSRSDRGEASPVRSLQLIDGGEAQRVEAPAVDFWECVIVRWEPGTPPKVQCPAATTPSG